MIFSFDMLWNEFPFEYHPYNYKNWKTPKKYRYMRLCISDCEIKSYTLVVDKKLTIVLEIIKAYCERNALSDYLT